MRSRMVDIGAALRALPDPAMQSVLAGNLLAIYVALMALNGVIALALWWPTRLPLQRDLLQIWAFIAFSAAMQGALHQNTLLITLGFSSVFVPNMALSRLVATVAGVAFRWRAYAGVLLAAYIGSGI